MALTSVTSWSGPWQSFAYAFNGAITLQHVPSTLPGTVSNLSYMFDGATSFNGTLATWDTSAVTTMAGMFEGATSFNQPLPCATYNVTDMSYMFQGASAFNSPLFSQTALVTSMSFMFASDPVFNQPLSNWQTGAVTVRSDVNSFGPLTDSGITRRTSSCQACLAPGWRRNW